VGIGRINYWLIDHVLKTFDHDRSMLELGNQLMKDGVKKGYKTAKQYFKSKGYDHTSIDLNGKDDAIMYDLSKPVNMIDSFGVVTNLGTSEHVSNQYNCFLNIHNFCKADGLMIHNCPCIGDAAGPNEEDRSKAPTWVFTPGVCVPGDDP